jgi:polygalacturonase
VTSYRVANLQIREVAIFGYRTNSDGINVCNSRNAVVSNCFARTGDDLFSVKTLAGGSTAICDTVTFQNCVGWAGKARCYGITGEVERDITNITFKDCAVIYRDATWYNNRLGSLVVIVEKGGANISNVTFENIEIFRDLCRAINCNVLENVYQSSITGCTMQGINFRNITCNSTLKSKLGATNETNSLSVTFDGVKVNGVTLNAGNVTTYFEKDSYTSYTFE